MKDKERIKGIIEAILFTMGESVAISRLSEVLDIEEDTLKELLEEMGRTRYVRRLRLMSMSKS